MQQEQNRAKNESCRKLKVAIHIYICVLQSCLPGTLVNAKTESYSSRSKTIVMLDMISTSDSEAQDSQRFTSRGKASPNVADCKAMQAMHHTIPACYALAFLRGARARGVDVDALLNRHGLSAPDSVPPRLPLAPFSHLLNDLRHRMRDELLGFVSRPVKLGTFSTVTYQMTRCHTLQDALRLGLNTYRLLIDDFHVRVHVRGETASLEVRSKRTLPHRGFICSAVLYWTMALSSWLVQKHIPVLHANLDIPRPDSVDPAPGPVFDVPIHYGAMSNSVAFPAHWLERRVVADDVILERLIVQLPGALLVRFRDDTCIREQVRVRLRRRLIEGLPSLEQLADEMQMSSHVLRRRLLHEGSSYQAIKNSLRREAAIGLLLSTDVSAANVAQTLGFSEPSTFHRSFKLWTGFSPGEYRRRHTVSPTPVQKLP